MGFVLSILNLAVQSRYIFIEGNILMKKVLIAAAVLVVLVVGVVSLPLFADGQMYSGEPAFNKLTPEVAATTLFDQAPKRTAIQTNLASLIAGTNLYYSHYQMNPQQTQSFMTKYYTNEWVKDASGFGLPAGTPLLVHGRGISFGGIFWPLEMMTATNAQGKQIYFNKVNIYELKNPSGQLFPLKVGNDLKFDFARTHVRTINGQTTTINDHGVMEYKVVAVQDGYANSKNPLPGKVYTIQIWESTNVHPQKYLTDIYDYSESLGWYVEDNYYSQSNQNLITYRLYNWH